VPGRAERYGGGQGDAGPLVVVDYAHTPDALEKILLTLREVGGAGKRGRRPGITCVFGCGGDRDRGKRAMMGRIATRCADRVIVTSDNPRGEDPMAIIADILEGATRDCMVIEDRRRAVREAIHTAARGDIVVIAGKGHESYQEIRGVRYPYSDAQAVRAALGRANA
jgi:UDP-N-acetylmuramoyl-L-alanyl-D-glutamate--2,6-diaminopimelate ligase